MGVSVVIEGTPGIGKTFLAGEILACVPPGQAKVLRVAGQQGRRNDPFTVATQLLGDLTAGTDPADAAFDHVDELCGDGPVVLCADDAHQLDAASLTLLRRLVWASRSLPLAVLVTTRPGPYREPLAMLIRQAQARLWLPPMGRMMVERLVFDQTGRWPGPLLRRILGLAAGNPLFVGELLRGYGNAGALTDVGPDAIEARFELTESQCRTTHRRAAEVLTAAGYRPSLIADHLLRAAGTDGDPALVTALREAVAATRGYAPEVTADLLDDVAAIGADVPGPLLLDHADALFRQGRGESAETLIRERIATVTDPGVAARLQLILIRSLVNRADAAAALEVIERTAAIAGLPGATVRQLEGTRAWLLILAGRGLPAAELDAMMARFAAAGDTDAQSSILTSIACTAFLAGRPEVALDHMRNREALLPGTDNFRYHSSSLSLPAMFELAASGPAAAQAELGRARRLAAGRHAEWVDPFLGFIAGGIVFAAADWDDAVAELDAALELAEETGTGWISLAVGIRAYIDAHRGSTGQARARLESFRHRGLPLQFGHDRPGWAELAVLEAEGASREAGTLARTLWSAARDHPGRWAADLAPDVTRVALAGMDRRLAGQLGQDVSALCPPEVARLVRGMLAADPDAIGEAADELAGIGRLAAAAFAREELACAAAEAGDRDRAAAALDAALTGYQRIGAVPDRDRALARTRALGIRRSSREPHRDAGHGWAALTPAEVRIAALVRDGHSSSPSSP